MKLGVYKLNPKAKIPKFESDGAACFDVVAIGREGCVYSTGLAFEIPEGYHLKFYSRSSHGFRDDIRLSNCTAIIDSDYKGEVKLKLAFDGPPSYHPDWPMAGDRLAQAMLVKNVKTEIIEVFEQTESERGNGGFGSTGK